VKIMIRRILSAVRAVVDALLPSSTCQQQPRENICLECPLFQASCIDKDVSNLSQTDIDRIINTDI
jgi:hypothetical protein